MKRVIRIIVLLWSLTLIVGKETSITCIINEDCVLPCNSEYHDIIHWCNGKKTVHSFFDKKDQLSHQNAEYQGRTFMFSEQIPKGNISLLIKPLRINDKGTYKCYTANSEKNNEDLINLNVIAPIKQVDIEVKDDAITCTTKNVYPQPNITWQIGNKPIYTSNIDVSKDDQGLFTLKSYLTSQPIQDNHIYSCTVTLTDQSEKYTASLRPVPENVTIHSGDEAFIDCALPQNNNEKFTIKLTFNDFTTTIYENEESQDQYPPTMWGDINVQLTPEEKLHLHNLDTEKHEGIYTCETTTAQSKRSLQTLLKYEPGQSTENVALLIIGIFIFFTLIIIIPIVIHIRKRRTANIGNPRGSQEETELDPLETPNSSA